MGSETLTLNCCESKLSEVTVGMPRGYPLGSSRNIFSGPDKVESSIWKRGPSPWEI